MEGVVFWFPGLTQGNAGIILPAVDGAKRFFKL